MPDDRYYRRGHWVRKTVPERRAGGTWTGLAVAAVLGWGLLNGCVGQETPADAPPSPPATSGASR